MATTSSVLGECDRSWAKGHSALGEAADAASAIDGRFLASVEECVSPADPMVVIYTSGSRPISQKQRAAQLGAV